jgi:hypothetical protein
VISGADIADSIDNANRTLSSDFTFSDTAWFGAIIRLDSVVIDADIADSSIYFGDVTGRTATTASYNVGIGYQSLKKMLTTNPECVVAIGYAAACSLTTGGDNTAIGAYALKATTTGIDNTGIGYKALEVAAGASNYNTAVGGQALANVSTGDNNVSVGRYSGLSVTTGSGNIFLGYGAGQDFDGSNALYIDNTSDATPLILGDFTADKITINGQLKVTDTLIIPLTNDKPATATVGTMLLDTTGTDTLWIYMTGAWVAIKP